MIAAKELAAEIDEEILSARSTGVPVLRAIRKSVSRKMQFWDHQIVIEAALALSCLYQLTRVAASVGNCELSPCSLMTSDTCF
jgi:hypothetical protein